MKIAVQNIILIIVTIRYEKLYLHAPKN